VGSLLGGGQSAGRGDRPGCGCRPILASCAGAVGAACTSHAVGWAALDFQSRLGGGSGWSWVAACSGQMGGGCVKKSEGRNDGLHFAGGIISVVKFIL
jgi:hypothetical protein